MLLLDQQTAGVDKIYVQHVHVKCMLYAYCVRSSDKLFRNHVFFSEKIIVGPQEGEISPPLAQMVLTQCISISELLVYRRAPPGGQI